MSFDFSTQFDQDLFIRYQGMIKHRNGLFASKKQAKYLQANEEIRRDRENMKKYFGLDVAVSQGVVQVSIMYRWADYGSRSQIPGVIFFVLDKYGVVAKYKIGGNGNGRDGWAPDPKKLKLMWERPADLELPEWADEPEPEDNRPKIVSGRFDLEVVVKSVKWQDGYYGNVLKMLVETAKGNRLWGSVPSSLDVEVGNKVKFKATVEPSPKDEHFGFFKRPSKAEVVMES